MAKQSKSLRVILPGCRAMTRAKIIWQSLDERPRWILIEAPEKRRRGRRRRPRHTLSPWITDPVSEVDVEDIAAQLPKEERT